MNILIRHVEQGEKSVSGAIKFVQVTFRQFLHRTIIYFIKMVDLFTGKDQEVWVLSDFLIFGINQFLLPGDLRLVDRIHSPPLRSCGISIKAPAVGETSSVRARPPCMADSPPPNLPLPPWPGGNHCLPPIPANTPSWQSSLWHCCSRPQLWPKVSSDNFLCLYIYTIQIYIYAYIYIYIQTSVVRVHVLSPLSNLIHNKLCFLISGQRKIKSTVSSTEREAYFYTMIIMIKNDNNYSTSLRYLISGYICCLVLGVDIENFLRPVIRLYYNNSYFKFKNVFVCVRVF